MAVVEFKLPDIGEGVAEGEIVKWLASEGDAIEEDQPMVEVMTDKATVEITSPVTGKVLEILRQEGDVVPVHEVIVRLEDGAAGGKEDSGAEATQKKDGPPAGRKDEDEKEKEREREREKRAPAAKEPAPARAGSAPAPRSNGAGTKVLATPATRKLARDLGVDIAGITGSGPRGRVTKDDVRAVAERPAAPAEAAEAPAREAPRPAPAAPARAFTPGQDETIPYRGLRRAIGEQMVKSAFTAPHFTLVEEVDMSELYGLRKEAAGLAEERGIRFTFLPLIMRALVSAIRRFPTINAHMDTDAGEVTVKGDVHVGIATDTDRGLLVPVVEHADKRTMMETAAEIQRLAEGARAGSLKREELSGSTITITSAGSIGGLFATPIINHPEVAILGVYQIKDKPVIRDGEIVPGKIGYLSITLDHRIVDGGTAARVMKHMKTVLEQPKLLLLDS